MKIALLSHMHHAIVQPYAGGTEAHTGMLANELVARGHEVTLFAKEGSRSAATVYPLVPADFEFVRVATPLVREQQHGFLAEAVHHSIAVIHQSGFDVVVNNSLSALPFAFMRDLPMLTILHTPPTLDDITAIVTDAGWTPAEHHRYVTVSRTNAVGWRDLLPRVDVIYNGVDLQQWATRAAPRPGVAVWAARITPEKGLHIAIDAARMAGMEFEFAGPIANSDYMADEITPRLGHDVRYRGHLAHGDLAAFFGSGEVFVASPVWAEPFGLTIVEALASGTPVAALPNGALPELVTPDAGAISASEDARGLAAAIRVARKVPRSSARSSVQSLALDTMVDRYEDVLRELAAASASRQVAADGMRAP